MRAWQENAQDIREPRADRDSATPLSFFTAKFTRTLPRPSPPKPKPRAPLHTPLLSNVFPTLTAVSWRGAMDQSPRRSTARAAGARMVRCAMPTKFLTPDEARVMLDFRSSVAVVAA